jgi:hypothetical protein
MLGGKSVGWDNRADQLFKLGNTVCRGTGILPVFFGHGQDARAT